MLHVRIKTSLAAVCLLTLLMPTPFAKAATHVEVTVDQLNVRSTPGTTAQIVGMITKAARLPIVKEQKDWTQVKLANGQTGWINNKFVKMIEIPQVKYVKSNVDMLNVREEPNTNAQILQIIDKNGVFLQMKKQGDWTQIKLSDKANGWVNSRYLSETSAPSAPAPAPVSTPKPTPTPTPAPTPAVPQVPATPAPIEQGQGTIYLTEGREVFASPDILGTVIGQLSGGTTIQHFGYAGGWYTISYNGTRAYIYYPIVQEQGGQAVPGEVPAVPAPNAVQETASIRVKNADTNLRGGPGTTYPVVGTVQPGQVFPIVQTEGDWYLIRRPDQSTAYIAAWVVDRILPAGSPAVNGTDSSVTGYNNGMIGNEKVYIYHTHNRESWKNVARNTKGSSIDDPEINITLVGKRLGELLNMRGIESMANRDDFAQKLAEQKKSFSMSYTESFKAVMDASTRSPNLKYIFDIHRDSDEPRSKVALTINGKTYSRILFVIGTANPSYLANKKLAENLHARFEASYPGLSRGVLLKGKNEGNGVYNQSVSEGSLLLEFGGTNNTLEECYNTAEAFADVFGNYLLESQIAFQ